MALLNEIVGLAKSGVRKLAYKAGYQQSLGESIGRTAAARANIRASQAARSSSNFKQFADKTTAQDIADIRSARSGASLGSHSLSTRERVLNNINESRRARQANNSSYIQTRNRVRQNIEASKAARQSRAEAQRASTRKRVESNIEASKQHRKSLLQQETQSPAPPTSTPTANQKQAGASKKSSSPSGQPAQNTSMFGAKVKALRSQGGKADIQAANRLEGEHTAFMELINNGQHKEAAEMIGATGDFSSNIAGLRKQGDKYFAGQAEQGPGIQDYIFGHKIPSTAVGLGIAGGAIAAVNSNGGRRSNADLYSSPF